MADAQRLGAATERNLRLPTESEPGKDQKYLTPQAIVDELDRYIIGQHEAKRAVAIALRNRYRRQQLDEEMRQEVQPRNILMIGSTGIGKTEIARRVARIVDAPFIKVEATKFTEVGYVGRDVESIIRDLVEIAISMLHREQLESVREEAARTAVERLTEIIAEQAVRLRPRRNSRKESQNLEDVEHEMRLEERRLRRELKRVRQLLEQQQLEDETVEIEVDPDEPADDGFDIGISPWVADEMQEQMVEFLEGLMPRRRLRRKVSVREARRILAQQEANRLVDYDALVDLAIRRVEDAAVVFIDELDKTISGSDGESGPDVSGEGVQRDLLPIVEGSTVMTRYGPVRTDHVLFIAAGAFHRNRPSELIPELQGRFPIRVELQSLGEDELFQILTEPRNALTRQIEALLQTEDLTIRFAEDGLREIAHLADQVNQVSEDIGARRLHTILERVIEELSFSAPDRAGTSVTIDREYVRERVAEVADDRELSDFIL